MTESRAMEAELVGRLTRVVASVIGERVRRPVARQLRDVPGDPSTMTTEWLTEVLCGGARVGGVSVSDMSLGSSSRGRLELTEEHAERNAKLPASVRYKAEAI